MGGSDCYCALCGGPLYSNVEIGRSDDPERPLKVEDEDEDWEYHYTYSSDALREEQVTWLGKVRAVGRNPQSERCYISGEADPVDDLRYMSAERGGHPHAPSQDDQDLLTLYMYEDAIPVHDQCLNVILPKVHAWKAGGMDGLAHSSMADIDLDQLYTCMEQSLHGRYSKTLGLNYYEAQESTTEQWWVCNRGQEGLVADPISVPQLQDYYAQFLRPTSSVNSDQSTLPSVMKRNSDVHANTTLEAKLEVPSTFSIDADMIDKTNTFITAKACGSAMAWKQRIKADMPWLWDLPVEQASPDTDWQRVYLDLNRRSTFESPDAILGLVNRRRIWNVCLQLAVPYFANLLPIASDIGETEEDIRVHSASPYTPLLTVVSKDAQPRRIKSVWVSDIANLESTPSLLKSCWNSHGQLKGLSIEYENHSTATFGLEPSKKDTIKSVTIDRGDWIQGFRFYVDGVIEGLQVTTKKRISGLIMECEYHAHIDMIARPGTSFVGLEGDIADGIISRIGVLEYTKDHEHLNLPPLPFTNRQLWYDNDPFSPPMNDKIEAYPYHEGSWTASTAERKLDGLTPVLLGEDEYQEMTSISAKSNLEDIEFHTSGSAVMMFDRSAQDTQMKWFPVDGAGGERVVGIEVEVAELPNALRIVTNRGRQQWFGVPRKDSKRHRYLPRVGHAFAGLYYGSSYDDQMTGSSRLSAISMLSSPGSNENKLMFDAPQDSNGHPWESAPPPADWEPSGTVLGSATANMVAWLDLRTPIDKIEGLLATPPHMEVFDLDGIRVVPQKAATDNLPSVNGGDVVEGGSPDDDMEAYEAWCSEQERCISIGTPPPASYLLPKKRKLRPTADKFSYPVDEGQGAESTSDALDGAVAHPEDKKASGSGLWHVPGQRIGGISVWAGRYLHGFQFHAASGVKSPGWGKCGGPRAARWDVGLNGKAGSDHVVGLKFFLGDTRGPYRLQELKIVGIQRMVGRAAGLAKRIL